MGYIDYVHSEHQQNAIEDLQTVFGLTLKGNCFFVLHDSGNKYGRQKNIQDLLIRRQINIIKSKTLDLNA